MRTLPAVLLLLVAGASAVAAEDDWAGFPEVYTPYTPPSWADFKTGVTITPEATLRDRYTTLRTRVSTLRTNYNELKVAFEALLAAYNSMTEQYNSVMDDSCATKLSQGTFTTCETNLRTRTCTGKLTRAAEQTVCEKSFKGTACTLKTTATRTTCEGTLNTTLTDTKAKLDAATSDKNKLATQVDQLVNTPCNQKFVGTTQTNASLRTDCEIALKLTKQADKLKLTPTAVRTATRTLAETELLSTLAAMQNQSCIQKNFNAATTTKCETEIRTTDWADKDGVETLVTVAEQGLAEEALRLTAENSDITERLTNVTTQSCNTKNLTATSRTLFTNCEIALRTKSLATKRTLLTANAFHAEVTKAERELIKLSENCTQTAKDLDACEAALDDCGDAQTALNTTLNTCTAQRDFFNATLATNRTALAACTANLATNRTALTACTANLNTNKTALAACLNSTDLIEDSLLKCQETNATYFDAWQTCDGSLSVCEANFTAASEGLDACLLSNATYFQKWLDCEDNVTTQANVINNFEEFPVRKLLKKKRRAE